MSHQWSFCQADKSGLQHPDIPLMKCDLLAFFRGKGGTVTSSNDSAHGGRFKVGIAWYSPHTAREMIQEQEVLGNQA